MIPLTRLDGTVFHVNAAFIVTIEQVADTVVHLQTGSSIMVCEKAVAVVDLVASWQRRVRATGTPQQEQE